MARKKRASLRNSGKSEAVTEDSSSNVYTIVVDSHEHAGVKYHSGDPIILDNPATVDKLRKRGIIS
jgi:predicted GNAT family acetyltransferase